MPFIIDATQTSIDVSVAPKRIISLVPSTTHSICALDMKKHLVGVTRFCTEPVETVEKLPKVGGTKNISVEKVLSLRPDIILANKEENSESDIIALRKRGLNVYVAFPKTVEEACSELHILGTILHKDQQAQEQISLISLQRKHREPFRYAYLIWNKPLMTISSECFISAMLTEIGGKNIFADNKIRYPVIENIPSEIDALLLSSEPFPFQEKHRSMLATQFSIPLHKIHFIDGAYCSWHGSKMIKALSYLHNWRDKL